MAHEPCANAPHSAYIIALLNRYATGADLIPGDPTLATATKLQRAGLLSVRPVDTPLGPRARVRLTDAGYAALEAAPRPTGRPGDDR